MPHSTGTDAVITAVRRWLETVVIGLNLCPFAARELRLERIRFAVTSATTETQVSQRLRSELQRLDSQPDIETTLLILPNALQKFGDYNNFLDTAENLLKTMDMEGIYQIASFHPHYQFAGTRASDAENYTNRSPYPVLHLLREASLEKSIARYPDVNQIPQRNIALMQQLKTDHLEALLRACFV